MIIRAFVPCSCTIPMIICIPMMDPPLVQSTTQPSIEEEDEWDTDGFVIPSLTVGDSEISKPDELEVKDSEPSDVKATKEEENIYLGPHGGRSSSLGGKQQELNSAGSRKQKLKQKLKDTDWKFMGATGRENKMENLRQLVGSGKQSANTSTMQKSSSSPRDWLDPHCHEAQFERSYSYN